MSGPTTKRWSLPPLGGAAWLGASLLLLFLLIGLIGPLLLRSSPSAQDLDHLLEGPSRRHWLGTDENGCDLLTQMCYGARLLLGLCSSVVSLCLSLGLLIGVSAGYIGGWFDELPEWALRPENSAAPTRGGLRLDRWSRALLVLAVVLVAGFALWSRLGRREAAAAGAQAPFAPMLALQAMGAPASVLEGSLRMSGLSFEGWRCWLAPLPSANAPAIAESFVRADGTFRFETSARGTFELHVQDLPGAGASHRLVRTVDLDGTTQRVDLEVPSFVARGGEAGLAGKDLVHAWSNASADTARAVPLSATVSPLAPKPTSGGSAR